MKKANIMIANELISNNAIHPGEMLADELEYRKISQKAFAELIGMKPSLLNEIIKGKRSVSTEYAMLFEAALGIEANIWVNLQCSYDKEVASSRPSFMARLKEIQKMVAML